MSQDSIVAICTRLESRRLPGKALLTAGGLPLLEHAVSRIAKTGLTTFLCVPKGHDQPFRDLARDWSSRYGAKVLTFEGDPDSPLHRMAELVKSLPAFPQYVVRVTHDDPLIDPETVLGVLDKTRADNTGYGYSPGICEGAGVEVVHARNIVSAAHAREAPTEFVSYFVKGDRLPVPGISRFAPRPSVARHFRLTVDYPEDLTLLKCVLQAVGPGATLDKVCAHLDANPHLLRINKLPTVTFYTCAHNAEPWVEEAVLSVLRAGVPNSEYIIVDDGSTDATLSRVAPYADGRKVRVVSNERNVGLAASSNIAVGMARGRVVVRVDADDILIATAFNKHFPAILQAIAGGSQIVYPSFHEVDASGDIVLKANVDPRESNHAGGAIMDRAFLNELRFRDGLRYWDGLELHRRAREVGVVTYYDVPLWQYRRRPGSMSAPSAERERARGAI